MGSFVQARYVHWRTVGKCPIHKNTLGKCPIHKNTLVCEGSIFLSYSVSDQWLDSYLEGLAFRIFLVENLIVF